MSLQSSERIEKQLQRAKNILIQTEDTIGRIKTSLQPTEQSLMLKEFKTRTVLDPGESKVVLCLEEELAISKAFSKALSKMDGKKPTLVKIPEESNSRLTNLTVARMIPSEVLAKEDGQVIVVNVQKERMLKHLENSRTVIIGDRYSLQYKDTVQRLSKALQKLEISVITDIGLHGGGSLTFELVRTLGMRPKSTVLEMTLSCSVADNSESLRRIIEALLSL
ncbi:MAG: hypothetical protein ACFFED_08455 [Candidatus Thorarchaeota archaeon]